MDTDDIKEKLLKAFKWDSLLDNLPMILAIGGGIMLLDKFVDIGTKLEPVYRKVKKWNSDGIFEIIDTIGDNIQLLDSIFKTFKINLKGDELDKLADFLQNVGTSGKYITQMWSLIVPKLKKMGISVSKNYRELT